MKPNERLIVALDTEHWHTLSLIDKLRPYVSKYKIGVSALFDEGCLDLVRYLVDDGMNVMLDLKLYDTRDTVRRTMELAEKLGVHFVTVHIDCIRYTLGFKPKVLAVTQLTDGTSQGTMRFSPAHDAECDGYICSAMIAFIMRKKTSNLLVCPGIRGSTDPLNNHIHHATSYQAIKMGANYIIVGRPIYASSSPVAAVKSIIKEIEKATA